MFDLVLKGGKVIDPSRGLDGVMDVAIAGRKIAAVEPNIPDASATQVMDVSGKMVMPGLVDFHAHVYWGANKSGVDPDLHLLRRGVTTIVDGGSAGADNFPGFVRYTVRGCRTRVLGLVNISCLGLVGNRRAGELTNPAYADPEGAAEMLRRYPDAAIGLKARLSEEVVGGSCLPILKIVRELADQTGVPLTVHVGNTVESLGEIVEWLKPGDIVAHFMTGRPNGSLDSQGRILPQIKAARERGVLFDVAAAMVHFSYDVAERMLEQGFAPDALGTDVNSRQVGSRFVDVSAIMSIFVMLGMPLTETVRLATSRAAELLGKADQFGSLKPGLEADVAVFEWEEGEFPITDGVGETRVLPRWLAPRLTVRGGEIVGA